MSDPLSVARAASFPNTFKQALYDGKVVSSIICRAMPSYLIAQLAANAGIDAVMVDMEHTAVGLETSAAVFAACMAAGITPLVRVPANTSDWISRSLDAGAMGVIVPHVNSAEEARNVVRYTKFAPLARRLSLEVEIELSSSSRVNGRYPQAWRCSATRAYRRFKPLRSPTRRLWQSA